MRIERYLFFDGQCEEAVTFYATVLGGQIEAMLRYEGAPAAEDIPPEGRDKIMHARLVVGDQALMASDAWPGRHDRPQGLSVSLQIDEPGDAERLFHALAEGGEIQMPMEQTFLHCASGR